MVWRRQNVYIGLGDYQTLLRPLKRVQESDEVDNDDDDDDDVRRQLSNNDNDDDDERWQSSSYGDDTLRAIAVITQKYDSFKRRQARRR